MAKAEEEEERKRSSSGAGVGDDGRLLLHCDLAAPGEHRRDLSLLRDRIILWTRLHSQSWAARNYRRVQRKESGRAVVMRRRV